MGKKRFGAWKKFYEARKMKKVTERNKLKRILKSQGEVAAKTFAKKFGLPFKGE